jgi:glucan 1,3-beta-glucosidase
MTTTSQFHWQSPEEASTQSVLANTRPLSEIIDQEQQEQLKLQFNHEKLLDNGNPISNFTPFNHANLSGQTITPNSYHQQEQQHEKQRRQSQRDSFNASVANHLVSSPASIPARFRNGSVPDDEGSVFSFLVNTPTSANHPAREAFNSPTQGLGVGITDTPTSRISQRGLGSYNSAAAAALGSSLNTSNNASSASSNLNPSNDSLFRAINDNLSDSSSESDFDEEESNYDARHSYASSHNNTSNSILNPRDHLNSVFVQDPDFVIRPSSQVQQQHRRESINQQNQQLQQQAPPVFSLPLSPAGLNSQQSIELQDQGRSAGVTRNTQFMSTHPSQETVVGGNLIGAGGASSSRFSSSLEKQTPSASDLNNSNFDSPRDLGGIEAGSFIDQHTETSLAKEFSRGLPPDGGDNPASGTGSLWQRRRKLCIVLIALAILVVILIAVLVPIGVVVVGNNNNSNSNSTNTTNSFSTDTSSHTSLAKNSTSVMPDSFKGTFFDVSKWKDTTDFNTTFTDETVGGLPIIGLNSTWDDSQQPNINVPPLEKTFTYGELPIRGVNLGGWLILEPFITPSFFSKYPLSQGVVDEWSLTNYVNSTEGMDAVVELLENHYATFVTEASFKEIAEAGLDHVRIPFGYWAVQTWPDEHYLPQISWRYLLRGIEWARKYGLRVKVDLHSVPGGQNGWNHSGRQNSVKWLNGTDGAMYGQRALDIHAKLGKFFAQDRYKNIVTLYGLVNEPRMQNLNITDVINWTKNATTIVRNAGYKGTVIFGDGFLGVDAWKGKYPEATFPNMALDVHQYTIFDKNLLGMSHTAKINYVCEQWSSQMARSTNLTTGHGNTLVGEWSQADNDCTLYLNNVGVGSRWEGDFVPDNGTPAVTTMSCNGGIGCSCNVSNSDPKTYSDAYKQFLLNFAEVQMTVFESNGGWGSMYWAWDTETIESSQWSYKKARDAGIMPKVAYERSFNCSSIRPDYLSLGLPEGI